MRAVLSKSFPCRCLSVSYFFICIPSLGISLARSHLQDGSKSVTVAAALGLHRGTICLHAAFSHLRLLTVAIAECARVTPGA